MDAHYFAAMRETGKRNKQAKILRDKKGNELLRTTKYDKYEQKQHKLYGTVKLACFSFFSNWKHLSCTGFYGDAPHALPCKDQIKTYTDVIGKTEP